MPKTEAAPTLCLLPHDMPAGPCCAHAVQFKDHMKKSEAQSEFAKNKTLAEQRRFLPVYGVREEMMPVGAGVVLHGYCAAIALY